MISSIPRRTKTFIINLALFNTVMFNFSFKRWREAKGCITSFPNEKTCSASELAIVSGVRWVHFFTVGCTVLFLTYSTVAIFLLLTISCLFLWHKCCCIKYRAGRASIGGYFHLRPILEWDLVVGGILRRPFCKFVACF